MFRMSDTSSDPAPAHSRGGSWKALWLLCVFVAWLWLFSDSNYSVQVHCTSYILCLITEEGGKSQTIKLKLALVHETFVPRVCNLMRQTWLTAWNKDLETEIWPQTKRCWMRQTASNIPSEKVWKANCLLLTLSIRFWLYSRSIWAVVLRYSVQNLIARCQQITDCNQVISVFLTLLIHVDIFSYSGHCRTNTL